MSARVIYHIVGLVCAITGASMLGGWPAGLLAFGVWAMAGTMFDSAMERRS